MDEMKIPYVSKELCKYLRETYALPHALDITKSISKGDTAMGVIFGINEVIERLEAIHAQQEENDGIH